MQSSPSRSHTIYILHAFALSIPILLLHLFVVHFIVTFTFTTPRPSCSTFDFTTRRYDPPPFVTYISTLLLHYSLFVFAFLFTFLFCYRSLFRCCCCCCSHFVVRRWWTVSTNYVCTCRLFAICEKYTITFTFRLFVPHVTYDFYVPKMVSFGLVPFPTPTTHGPIYTLSSYSFPIHYLVVGGVWLEEFIP